MLKPILLYRCSAFDLSCKLPCKQVVAVRLPCSSPDGLNSIKGPLPDATLGTVGGRSTVSPGLYSYETAITVSVAERQQ